MDVIAIEAAAREAVTEIRAGGGPRFLECRTYRFRAHSMFDAQLYRDKAEVEAWKQKGPILRFRHWLEETGMLDAETAGRLDAEIEREIAAAVDFAESGDWEPVENLTCDVCTKA
jgi:TPP-dependent pyruvate/acetoin dehydrogenase alpha subunit